MVLVLVLILVLMLERVVLMVGVVVVHTGAVAHFVLETLVAVGDLRHLQMIVRYHGFVAFEALFWECDGMRVSVLCVQILISVACHSLLNFQLLFAERG